MTDKRDYYEVLAVERGASDDEIRKAYKKIALDSHPDRNPGDSRAESRFKEATEAFSVLSDADKRARYDQFGHAGLDGAGGFDFSGMGIGDIFGHFQDLFSELFGGVSGGGRSRRSGGARRGDDVRVVEQIRLRDALSGSRREVVVTTPVACETCAGSGVQPGTSPERCSACGGAGQVTTARGFVMFTSTCSRCRGQGQIVRTPCEACRGAGHVERSRKVVVSIPAGIDDGQRLRVPGQGGPGARGGPTGDLYVDVEVEPDPRFERGGLDLATEAHVSYADAALGTTVAVTLPDESQVDVEIPAGTQPGDVVAVKGKGFPRLDGRGRGALHVVVRLDVPRKIGARARKLLAELDAELRSGEGEGKRAGAR